MPNLVGVNAAVAEDKLRKLGFTKIDFGSLDPDDTLVIIRANWTVKKQSEKAGTMVSVDTLIVLSVSKK
jgi:beta-lactam-binding protein with PASTA domain